MQGLGASQLRYEVPLPTGRALDWAATWPDGSVYVEVATPVINASAGSDNSRNEALVEVVRRTIPPGWRVWLMEVPALGPNDSKAPLRQDLAAIVSSLPANPHRTTSATLRRTTPRQRSPSHHQLETPVKSWSWQVDR